MRKLLPLLCLLPLTANALCLKIHGDTDGNGTININDINRIKAMLSAYSALGDVAGSEANTCDGYVNINDENQEKAWLGNTVVWKTVGGNTYSALCDTCDDWTAESAWLNTYGNALQDSVAADQPCTPITYLPYHGVYSENTGTGHPSPPTIDLRNWFWGNSTSGGHPTYFTYCYKYSP